MYIRTNIAEKVNNEIASWLNTIDITTSLSPREFVDRLPKEQRCQLRNLTDVKGLVEMFNEVKYPSPFVFMYAKPQPASRGTRYFASFGNDKVMRAVDLSNNKVEDLGTVTEMRTKLRRHLVYKLDGENKSREFTMKRSFDKLDKCFSAIMNPAESKLHPLSIFFEPFQELPDEIPDEFTIEMFQVVKPHLTNMLISPNTEILSAIQDITFPTAVMRDLADFIAYTSFNEHKLFYVINSMLPTCMEKVKSPSLILRSENIVTRIMNTIRNYFCSDYFDNLAKQLESAIIDTRSTEELIQVTLEILEKNPPPNILRMLMLSAGEAAKNRFPDVEDAPLYGMGSIFLLRGLGPKLISKNPKLQSMFQTISQFFNFSNDPLLTLYVPQLQDYIENQTVDAEFDHIHKLPPIPEKIVDECGRNAISYFIKNRKEISEYTNKEFTPYKPGLEIFLEGVVKVLA